MAEDTLNSPLAAGHQLSGPPSSVDPSGRAMMTDNSVPPDPERDTEASQPARKRRRKALSCNDCKRRKLKCDRVWPACGRCVKGGYPETCHYTTLPPGDEHAQSDDEQDQEMTPGESNERHPELGDRSLKRSYDQTDGPGNGALASLIKQQEEKIIQLESRLIGLEKLINHPSTAAPASAMVSGFHLSPPQILAMPTPVESKASENPDTMLFRGKAFKSQYYGSTYPGSLVPYFLQLPRFTLETMKTPVLHRAHAESRSQRKAWKSSSKKPWVVTDQDLYSLLPSQEIIEASVQLYLSTFETTYRILHGPSFKRDLNTFMASPRQCRADFAAIILLVTATVGCCMNKAQTRYLGGSSVAREEASNIIFTIEAWLDRHSRKHMTLAFFQLHCLILLAKRANSIKVKQTWANAESLITLAAASGFHRDPCLLPGKITPYEQEMKRRLWATILELELLASQERGMPSAAESLLCDTSPPLNLDDEQFDEMTKDMPPPASLKRMTSTTFLCLSGKSLELRLRINNLLNNPKINLPYDEVMKYSDLIMEALQELSEYDTDGNNKPNTPNLPRVLLQLQLYGFLMVLWQRSSLSVKSSSMATFSQHMWQDAAAKIVELHSALYRAGDHTLLLSRSDLFQAGVSVCYDLYKSVDDEASPADRRPLPPPSLAHIEKQCILVEKSLDMIEDKIFRLGAGTGGSHQFWLLVSIYGVVKMKLNPGQERAQEQRAADRLTATHYRFLSLQVAGDLLTMSRSSMNIGGVGQQQQSQPLQISGIPQSSYERTQIDSSLPPLSELPEYSAQDLTNGGFDDLTNLSELVPWGWEEFWPV